MIELLCTDYNKKATFIHYYLNNAVLGYLYHDTCYGKGMRTMKIWAHRGCSQRYPENTLLAFAQAALLKNLTGIELDIQLTKDGEMVVIHDERVDRTTEGIGFVRDYTLTQLKKLHIYADDNPVQSIPAMEEVFDLLEYISHETQDITQGELPYDNLPSPEERYNEVFKKEYVGYRFIKGKIRNITDENEIQEIVKASLSPYEEVNFHLDKASERLSDRKNPDYENSIKESISAVEAMCVILLEEKGELGTLLKKLEKAGIKIHPALKEAFLKLYGYTSDAKGIRHAGSIGGTESTFEEAKFMLVSCSAFINYLKEVSIKIK